MCDIHNCVDSLQQTVSYNNLHSTTYIYTFGVTTHLKVPFIYALLAYIL